MREGIGYVLRFNPFPCENFDEICFLYNHQILNLRVLYNFICSSQFYTIQEYICYYVIVKVILYD